LKRVVGDFGRARVVLGVNATYATEHEIDAPDPGSTFINADGALLESYDYVGDLTDSVLFDIPSPKLILTNNIDARAGTPFYPMFPVENTTLNDEVYATFRRLYGEFYPRHSAVDLQLFEYPRATTATGHPFCALPGNSGLPINRTFSNTRATSNPD
jgi:hypothetical protein